MDTQQSLKNVENKRDTFKNAQSTANNAAENYFIAVVNHCYNHNCPKVVEELKTVTASTPVAKAISLFVSEFTGYKKNEQGNAALDSTKQNHVMSAGRTELARIGEQISLIEWGKEYAKRKANTPQGQEEKAKKEAERLEKARKMVADADSKDLVLNALNQARDAIKAIEKQNSSQALAMAQSFKKKALDAAREIEAGISAQFDKVS